jgi:uncharacterized iron-regulated membrane protein
LVVGVLTGGALLVLGLSGAALVLRPELDDALQAGPVETPSDAPAVSLDALVDAARRRHPGFRITRISLPERSSDTARIAMLDATGAELQVAVHPRTGQALGSFWIERSPFHALRLLHAELYAGRRGSVAVGLLGLWLLLQGVTGVYLLWPLMTRPRWGFTVRWARPWPVVAYDLHKALGAASLVFHLPMAATGAFLGIAALQPGIIHDGPAFTRQAARSPLPLAALAREADRALPGGTITALSFPPGGAAVIVTMRMPGEIGSRGASVVVLDAYEGAPLSVQDARQAPWLSRLRAAARAIHVGDFMGDYGGTAVRLLYVAGGLASAGLALSGYVLALSRSRVSAAPRDGAGR